MESLNTPEQEKDVVAYITQDDSDKTINTSAEESAVQQPPSDHSNQDSCPDLPPSKSDASSDEESDESDSGESSEDSTEDSDSSSEGSGESDDESERSVESRSADSDALKKKAKAGMAQSKVVLRKLASGTYAVDKDVKESEKPSKEKIDVLPFGGFGVRADEMRNCLSDVLRHLRAEVSDDGEKGSLIRKVETMLDAYDKNFVPNQTWQSIQQFTRLLTLHRETELELFNVLSAASDAYYRQGTCEIQKVLKLC